MQFGFLDREYIWYLNDCFLLGKVVFGFFLGFSICELLMTQHTDDDIKPPSTIFHTLTDFINDLFLDLLVDPDDLIKDLQLP